MTDAETADGGYIDLQVNGYTGIDFNSEALTAEQLRSACVALQRDGVASVLATIVTEQLPIMCARLAKLVALREGDELVRHMIAGFHVEGPFLNETPGFRGAHPVDAIIPAEVSSASRLLESGGGLVRLVTLAPERDAGLKVTRLLCDAGVSVAGGHCDPTLDQLDAAIDAGLSVFTHLGNGCPMQLPRHDNVVQRALSRSERLMLCFIADGVHVPPFALRNYLRAAGIDRCCVVTDAMSAAGLGPGEYRLSRWKVQVGTDLAARSPDGSHLVGSAMTMAQNAINLKQVLNLSPAECRRLLVENPGRVLRGGENWRERIV